MKKATRARRMRQAIEAGKPYKAIAKRFGITVDTVKHARWRWGLRVHTKQARDTSRDAFIREQLKMGETLQKVGTALGITRERVRQIANRIGIKTRRSAALLELAEHAWQDIGNSHHGSNGSRAPTMQPNDFCDGVSHA